MSDERVSIRAVADAAGVSPTTVSLVYNKKGTISSETRERVLAVGEELGYRPGWISKVFRSGRTHVIGVVVRHEDSAIWQQTYLPYYRATIAGAAMEALEHRYSIAAVRADPSGSIADPIPLDGLIVVDPEPGDLVIAQALELGMAVVADGGYAEITSPRLRSILPALDEGMPLALDALVTLGAARPAFFRGAVDDEYTIRSQAAYAAWCESRRIEPLIFTLPIGQAAIEGARELLGGDDQVDGVHCINAAYATAIAEAAAGAGLVIPDRLAVSLVGEAHAATTDKRFVYLDSDPVSDGAQAARLLIDIIEGRSPDDVTIPMTLIVPEP